MRLPNPDALQLRAQSASVLSMANQGASFHFPEGWKTIESLFASQRVQGCVFTKSKFFSKVVIGNSGIRNLGIFLR